MKLRLLYIFFLAAVASLLCACNKNASDEVPATSSAYLDVVNATDIVFNVYQNGTRLSNSANIYFPGHSGYFTVLSGPQNFSVKQPLEIYTPQLANPDTLFTRTLTLDSTQHYTLFVSNHTAAGTFLTRDTLLTASNKANVRFVNASATYNGLSIAVNDTLRFTNKNYKSVSTYLEITPPVSSQNSTIKVYTAGSSTPVATSTVALRAGGTYTLYTLDTKTTTGASAVGIGQINNQ